MADRLHTLRLGLVLFAALVCGGRTARGAEPAPQSELPRLQVLRDDYPRAYFFRQAERPGKDRKLSFDDWEKTFSRLMGIQGKALEEELPGLSRRNIDFFRRFKQRHPEQLVLLHFNGNARDPRWETEDFFAGHWIYFNGAKIVADVPAEAGEREIQLSDARLFRTGVGRYRDRNEDVGLCALDAHGKPDWHESEQVQLLAVDVERNVIRVRRGCYGTRPRAFSAGKAYAAAHIAEGPWGSESQRDTHLLWFYNFATVAPRDQHGRSAADVLIDDLRRRFQTGGQLASFDGLQFDVLFFTNRYHRDLRRPGPRGMDADADGRIDQAIVNGVNTYGIGVVDFCRRLRAVWPDDKLLLADGMSETNQRAFGILNGIESEGFPHLNDREMRDWSGGLNRHWFWAANARPPVFNYINHKYVARDPNTKRPTRPEVPFGIHRLVFAAAVFTDAAICYSFPPRPQPDEDFGIWDELRKGTEHQLGWLGRPAGPAVRLAERQENLLDVHGQDLLKRLRGTDVAFAMDGDRVKVTSADPDAKTMQCVLAGVPTRGPDLYVTFVARAARRKDYPTEVARLLRVGPDAPRAESFMTWVNQKDFTPSFYFSDVQTGSVDLRIEIEGSAPLWISDLRVYAHADAIYREFENGLVLANPSPRSYTFKLAELFPGQAFHRLRGSSRQDPATNDGSAIGRMLKLPAQDALFLVKQPAR